MSNPIFDVIMKTIVGRDFGLDRKNDLYMRGSQIILNYDSDPVVINGASSGGAAAYSKSVSANLAATQNDYVIGALKNRALLTAFAGGSTVTGIQASDFFDGATLVVRNPSTTDSITFKHQSASSIAANRFSLPNGVDRVLDPLAGALLSYIVNQWVFLS